MKAGTSGASTAVLLIAFHAALFRHESRGRCPLAILAGTAQTIQWNLHGVASLTVDRRLKFQQKFRLFVPAFKIREVKRLFR
jgi:hypothetical protein